jgi:FkbM family methyltransferase
VTLFNMASREEIELSSSAAAKAIYTGEHTAICRVLNAYKMMVDTRDVGLVPHLLLEGYWESWVTHAVAKMVRPGMRVVNVGANFGYYALLFADLVGTKGEVVAFEPNPRVYEMLRKSRAMNGFTHLAPRPEAVTDGSAPLVRFAVPDGFYQNAHIVGSDEKVIWTPNVDPALEPDRARVDGEDAEVSMVRAVSLDQCDLGRVDLVFIDAEGAEPEIWDGMQSLYAMNPDLITVLEYSSQREVRPYADPIGFAERLQGTDRRLFMIEPSGELTQVNPTTLATGRYVPPAWRGECMVVVTR